jgi:tripartite ATP-independent transporter DctP family solute receptor
MPNIDRRGLLVAGAAATLATRARAASTLRLGVGTAPLSSETKALQEMARLCAERSGGDLKVDVFDSNKLGGSVAQIENLQLGTQDLVSNVADWYQYLDKGWNALAIPFLFSGVEHVKRFQATATYKSWLKDMVDKHGVRMLADNWYRLPRVLLTTKPVRTPEDLVGMRLRMPDLDTYLRTWGALGAKPTVIDFNEAFLAMKTGTVQGMEAPLSGVYPQKFYQAAPFITLTMHQIAPYTVIASEKSWRKLNAKQQEILTKAANDAGDWYYKLILDSFDDQKRRMIAEGAQFIETDPKPWAAKVEPVIRQFEAEGKIPAGLIAQIRGLAG